MNNSVQIIPLANLALAFLPALFVVVIAFRWSLGHGNMLYAISRMLVQLMLIGYLLAYIFDSNSSFVVMSVLAVMIFASSWIALRTVKNRRKSLYSKAFYAIALGGGATLIIVIWGVLALDPWYLPSYVIPLAGMIFANALNSVSLAADRLAAEIDRVDDYTIARNIAFRSSMIPITNSLFAVGLVSLPGMMTGQILSGVSPLIAARYQIMVMCMVFGSAGISSACFLHWVKPDFEKTSAE